MSLLAQVVEVLQLGPTQSESGASLKLPPRVCYTIVEIDVPFEGGTGQA